MFSSQSPNELPITRDEALLWLNDHIGKPLLADLRIGYNCVCSTEGNLAHWTDVDKEMIAGPTGAIMAQGLTGLYHIGEKTVFELTAMSVPWSFMIRQFPYELVASFESVEVRFTPKGDPV